MCLWNHVYKKCSLSQETILKAQMKLLVVGCMSVVTFLSVKFVVNSGQLRHVRDVHLMTASRGALNDITFLRDIFLKL